MSPSELKLIGHLVYLALPGTAFKAMIRKTRMSNVGERNVSRRQSRVAFDNFDDVVVFLNPATWKVDKMNSLTDSAYQLTRTT